MKLGSDPALPSSKALLSLGLLAWHTELEQKDLGQRPFFAPGPGLSIPMSVLQTVRRICVDSNQVHPSPSRQPPASGEGSVRQELQLGGQRPWVQSPTVLSPGCVTLAVSLNLSEPQGLPPNWGE